MVEGIARMQAISQASRAWDVSVASCSYGADAAGSWRRPALRSLSCRFCGLFNSSQGLHLHTDLRSSRIRNGRRSGAICALAKFRQAAVEDAPENLDKEPHKFFDQVAITVRSGDGGNGIIFNVPRPVPRVKHPAEKKSKEQKEKKKKAGPLKRGSNGEMILPMGGHGGDVVLYADESVSTLLDFHRKRRYNAKRGSNVDAMSKELSSLVREGVPASTLRIPVPVGTVVKKKKGGKLLADLALPGEEILVARGGHGGISIVEIPQNNRSHLRPINAPTMTDPEDKVLTIGGVGEEVSLELTLRVVADLGLVGLPNAGKSSLLAAVTRAKPDIADYPFTTLMPNLGRLEGDPDKDDGGLAMGATMADLPGLIKDAHLGKGLGRMFLRHLRRTRLLIHIVDAAAPDPVEDYKVLREELRMYNPDYVQRPHIVVLNKMDIPEAQEKFEVLQETIVGLRFETAVAPKATESGGTTVAALSRLEPDARPNAVSDDVVVDEFPPPVAVLGISARKGLGMDEFLLRVRQALREQGKESNKNTRVEPKFFVQKPSWQL